MTEMNAAAPARLTRALRALLYVLVGLTFIAGTQLFVLAEHTDELWSWEIDSAMTAVFVGAGFWSASVVTYWSSRQRDWVRARVPVPTILIVATLLLLATLDHFDTFSGLLGLAWIEVYALFAPIMIALTVRQLVLGPAAPHSGDRVPPPLRAAYAVQAALLVVVGILLYVGSADLRDDLWSWSLTPLTAKAVGTWLIGVGVIAGFIALVDDRADLPGNAVAQLVLGGVGLLGLARFGDEVDLGSGSGVLFVAFLVSMVLTGLSGVALCLREGRFAAVLEEGGVPVEMRRGNVPPVGP
jgi:hypothetical protein